MVITFVFDACNLGGTESAIKNRMDHLEDMGVDCRILFLSHADEDKTFQNHKYYIAENNSDIIRYTYDSDVIVSLSPLLSTAQRLYCTNKPLICECHIHGCCSHLPELDNKIVRAVIFPSKYELNTARSLLFKSPVSIPFFTVYNCIGKDFLHVNPPDKSDGSRKIVLWIGRIEHNKNWRLLLKIIERMDNTYLFRIISNIKVSSDYKYFIKDAQSKKLMNKIDIISDCPYSDMLAYYKEAADNGCYLSTSYNESFGMTVLEAMKAECPMVLNNIPAFREIAGNSAIYFDKNSIYESIHAIKKLSTDSVYASFTKTVMKKRYEEIFDSRRICLQFLEIIQTVLGGVW